MSTWLLWAAEAHSHRHPLRDCAEHSPWVAKAGCVHISSEDRSWGGEFPALLVSPALGRSVPLWTEHPPVVSMLQKLSTGDLQGNIVSVPMALVPQPS